MKINWKRILIASLWSEIAAFVIYVAAYKLTGSARIIIFFLDWFGLMLLGGLWVSRKIESRFVLHGFLVGIGTNILYLLLRPLDPSVAADAKGPTMKLIVALFVIACVKILGCMLGAYIGGKRKTILQSVQVGKSQV